MVGLLQFLMLVGEYTGLDAENVHHVVSKPLYKHLDIENLLSRILVEIHSVSRSQRIHKFINCSRTLLFYKEMEMIRHETIGEKRNFLIEII